MDPSPDVHNPAMALKSELLPAPELPTMRRFSPSRMDMSRLEMRVRFPSGVVRVRLCIASASRGAVENRSIPNGAIWFNAILGIFGLARERDAAVVAMIGMVPSLSFSKVVALLSLVAVIFCGSWSKPSSADRKSSASRMAVMKEDKRSIAAEKELNCSNWLTMTERSRRTWLNAPADWDTTPSWIAPLKYCGATTHTGKICTKSITRGGGGEKKNHVRMIMKCKNCGCQCKAQ